jgi:hypothetical protein
MGLFLLRWSSLFSSLSVSLLSHFLFWILLRSPNTHSFKEEKRLQAKMGENDANQTHHCLCIACGCHVITNHDVHFIGHMIAILQSCSPFTKLVTILQNWWQFYKTGGHFTKLVAILQSWLPFYKSVCHCIYLTQQRTLTRKSSFSKMKLPVSSTILHSWRGFLQVQMCIKIFYMSMRELDQW